MMKIWVVKFFVLTFLFIGGIGIINYAVDPLQQYRQATFYKPVFSVERYLNPGLAKTYDYNSIIIGSSMVENFILSNISSILEISKPIKLCMSGASAHDIKYILDVSFKNKQLDSVIYGLDLYAFSGSPIKSGFGENSMPGYLYDDNYFNDYKYLLNIDTLKSVSRILIKNTLQPHDPLLNFDTMYQWQLQHKNDFGEDNVMKQWKRWKRDQKNFVLSDYTYAKMVKSFKYNFLPFVEKQKDTMFYIFYPPYSILAYKDMQDKKWFRDAIKFKKYVFETLKQYSNVKIYDFQVAKDFTQDLSNYRDPTHYHQSINKWMLRQIKDDNYLINDKNVENYIQNLVQQVNDYSIPRIK